MLVSTMAASRYYGGGHPARERLLPDRSGLIRETLRRTWSRRTRDYAAAAAGHRAHTAMLVAKARPRPGERVLDVGTGSGVVAVAAAQAVGPTGRVVATDLVPEWGELVAPACAEARVSNVEFRTMDAEALELPDASFDVALSQFSLMFVPDPVAALREIAASPFEGKILDLPRLTRAGLIRLPWLPAGPRLGDIAIRDPKVCTSAHELERLQAARSGAPASPPAVLDVTVSGGA
jgi:SAM-dependent methyltransferase